MVNHTVSHAEPELRQRADAIVDAFEHDDREDRIEALREAIARGFGRLYDDLFAAERAVALRLHNELTRREREVRVMQETTARLQETVRTLESQRDARGNTP